MVFVCDRGKGGRSKRAKREGAALVFLCHWKRVGEGTQGDNASKGANSRKPESILTDSYSLCIVCNWDEEWKGDRKLYYVCKNCSESVYADSLCLYVRPQQQYRIQAIHHCTYKISPFTEFLITNSIFNILDNVVVIIHCKSIQSHCPWGTKSIQYSYKTDNFNHWIVSCRIQQLCSINSCKGNIFNLTLT